MTIMGLKKFRRNPVKRGETINKPRLFTEAKSANILEETSTGEYSIAILLITAVPAVMIIPKTKKNTNKKLSASETTTSGDQTIPANKISARRVSDFNLIYLADKPISKAPNTFPTK